MFVYLQNGQYFDGTQFLGQDIFVSGTSISKIGTLEVGTLKDLDIEVLDCSGCYLIPGLIDPHLHLAGGSGEIGGFHSQSMSILLSEAVAGGVTTLIGTIGVDTTTKSMPELIARCKAFNELGLTAYCYTGGYDCPPKTLTDSVRNDLIFIPEVIGVGELAIADRRAPEPDIKDLAKACIDAYVGGMLANKPGVSHIHVGDGVRRMQTLRDLMEKHVVLPGNFHITHIGRSEALIKEAVEMARQGCYVDLDLWDRDFSYWYQVYLDLKGPLDQLTVSSDASKGPPADLWYELKAGVLTHGFKLEDLLKHFTSNTAQALKLSRKGRLVVGCDADIAVFNKETFEMKHVISRGQILMKDGKLNFINRPPESRREFDVYGIRKEKDPPI